MACNTFTFTFTFTLLLNSLLSYSQNHEIISTYYEKVGSSLVFFFFWFGDIPLLGICRLTWVLKGRILKFLKLSKVHCKDTAGASSIRLLTSQFLYLKPNYFICTTNFHLDTLNDQIILKTLEKKMWIWIHQSVSWEEGSGELRCPESTWETQKT